MKTYTAIYSTKAIKNIQYSFSAVNMEAAKEYAKKSLALKESLLLRVTMQYYKI